MVDNPSKLPDPGSIDEMREPIVEANILVPQFEQNPRSRLAPLSAIF